MEEKNKVSEVSEVSEMGPPVVEQATNRQSARGALNANITRLEKEVAVLRTLEKAVNWDLINEEQEHDLWLYFIRVR